SGYSSRTVTSSQSAVSGAKNSPPLTLDTSMPPPDNKTAAAPTTTTTITTTPSTAITPSSKRDPNRVHRKARTRDCRSPREDNNTNNKMQVGSYPSGPYHGSTHRS